jgi:hypothetical protein
LHSNESKMLQKQRDRPFVHISRVYYRGLDSLSYVTQAENLKEHIYNASTNTRLTRTRRVTLRRDT